MNINQAQALTLHAAMEHIIGHAKTIQTFALNEYKLNEENHLSLDEVFNDLALIAEEYTVALKMFMNEEELVQYNKAVQTAGKNLSETLSKE